MITFFLIVDFHMLGSAYPDRSQGRRSSCSLEWRFPGGGRVVVVRGVR